MFNGEEFGKQIVAATTDHINKTVAPLLTEIGSLKAEVAALKAQKQFDPADIDRRIEAITTDLKASAETAKAEGKEKRKAALADLKASILADCETIAATKFAELPAPEPVDVKALVEEAVAAIERPQDGKDADPELMASLVKETVERTVAGWERPQDGKSVTVDDVRPLIEEAVLRVAADIRIPKDGRDGFDGVEFLRGADGHLLVTMSNGTVRDLGEFVGKDGRDGKDADMAAIESKLAAIPESPDVDLVVVTRMIEEAVAKQSVPVEEFAPDDVAANVALAVKMMAETPQTQARQEAQQINVYSNVTTPEMKAPETTVNLTVPEQVPPVVNMGETVVNVAPASIEFPKRGKEITKVTGWDKNGRITSFEKTDE